MPEYLSVLIYVAIQVFPLVWLLIMHGSSERKRIVQYLVAFAPICLFAAVRGAVGTDTANYREYYETFDISAVGVSDPLFLLFQVPFRAFGLGSQVFLAAQAVFCWALLSVGAARADRRVPLLGIGLMPVLLLDATFNGLRYGMAFAVALLLIGRIERPGVFRGGLAAVLPGLFHSSMLVLMLTRIRSRLVAVGVVVAVFYIVRTNATFMMDSYLFRHVLMYGSIQRLQWYSGALPLFQIALIWFIAWKAGASLRLGPNVFTVGIGAVVVGVGLLTISYASLRMLQVGVFLLAAAVSRAPAARRFGAGVSRGWGYGWTGKLKTGGHRGVWGSRAGEEWRWRRPLMLSPYVAVCVLGVVGVLNFWRQIFFVGPEGFVFFVPYEFFFQ